MRLINKKGNTLVELIITMAVFTIFNSFIIFNFINLYKKVQNHLDVKSCSSEIMSIVNESKIKCEANNKDGKISFYNSGKIVFKYPLGSSVDVYNLPEGFRFVGRPSTLKINNEGVCGTTSTIYYYDRYNKRHSISIKVATTYVDIKN